MALLDPVTGTLGAVAVSLAVLGMLVVFIETVRPSRLIAALLADGVLTALLVSLGEIGLGILVLGFGAALVANQVFEWLTTR